VEDIPFTKYLVKMATLLRDHLRTNVSDETIRKDMVDVVLYMQKLSKVCDRSFCTQLTKCRIKILVTYWYMVMSVSACICVYVCLVTNNLELFGLVP
jgi:hypothetical protein